MSRVIVAIFLVLATFAAKPALAELVVIANPESGVTELSQNEVINIYMGRYQKLSSGVIAFPVDLADARERFYKRLVDKTIAEINSYWARLVFTGRASPPRQMGSREEVLETVASNRGALGYLDESEVSGNVLIVFRLPAGQP
ncbi:hypothetical protein E4634_04675 [Mangrovimicrobium sediminis]|uniref:Phosphate ABC transporter substrate-binding protein n=1 Tax=Mangrovimicrobium sediminis TaxID=2562682 RepID=A0A4Z0M6Z4_9GAMM|nr:hypothetical protein [Haliea sp. SAOS-164]TGD75291.1 hypothetical protein E4634_04675 [Haliea sp. SAOS-164]